MCSLTVYVRSRRVCPDNGRKYDDKLLQLLFGDDDEDDLFIKLASNSRGT